MANKPESQDIMFKQLSRSISQLAGVLERHLEWQQSNCGCVTKQDLEQMEKRIIEAIGSGIPSGDPEEIAKQTQKLRTSTDTLERTVSENQPSGGGAGLAPGSNPPT